MGGERFEKNQQDFYLFGENEDLNFLGSKPVVVRNLIAVELKCIFSKKVFIVVFSRNW